MARVVLFMTSQPPRTANMVLQRTGVITECVPRVPARRVVGIDVLPETVVRVPTASVAAAGGVRPSTALAAILCNSAKLPCTPPPATKHPGSPQSDRHSVPFLPAESFFKASPHSLISLTSHFLLNFYFSL